MCSSKDKVLLNECCEPNIEMRTESSLFWIADTKLQVMADAIHLDAWPSYMDATHLIPDLWVAPQLQISLVIAII